MNWFRVLACLFCLLALLITLKFTASYQYSRSSLLTEQELNVNEDQVGSLFGSPPAPLPNSDIRTVLFVVIDGLGYNYVENHEDLRNFLNNKSFWQDSAMTKLSCQLPSISGPNWATLLSGSPPEFTGVISNDNTVYSYNMDTFFERAKRVGLKRGAAAAWGWSRFIKRSLDPLVGDGFVQWNDVHEDADQYTIRDAPHDKHDEKIASIVYGVFNCTNQSSSCDCAKPYGLFLGYFADVDARSHQWGTLSERVHSAVTNKTKILSKLVSMLDEKTVLVITADHGHVDVGGHGGEESSVMHVPFIVYKKNSNLRQKVSESTRISSTVTMTNLDVGPTVSALAGIPAPRQAQGGIINIAIPLLNSSNLPTHFQDLYHQKQDLVHVYLTSIGQKNLPEKVTKRAEFNGEDNAAIEFYQQNIRDLMQIFHNARSQHLLHLVIRNLFVSLFFLLAVLLIYLLFLHRDMSPLLLCNCTLLCNKLPFFKNNNNKSRNPRSAPAQKRAFGVSALTTALFYALVLPLFLLENRYMYREYSGWSWGLSNFNTDFDAYMLMAINFAIGLLCSLAVTHGTRFFLDAYWTVERSPKAVIKQLSSYCRTCFPPFSGTENAGQTGEFFYLYEHFAALHAMLAMCCLFVFMSSSCCFLFVSWLRVRYVNAGLWTLRFMTCSCLQLSLPHLLVCTVYLLKNITQDAAMTRGNNYVRLGTSQQPPNAGSKSRDEEELEEEYL